MSHLIVTLSKWQEFYDKYKSVIPDDLIPRARQIRSHLEERKVRSFRNKVIGHIWDSDEERPLTHLEVNRRFSEVVGDEPEDFLTWISESGRDDTVVAFGDQLKERLRADFDLKNGEIFPEEDGRS